MRARGRDHICPPASLKGIPSKGIPSTWTLLRKRITRHHGTQQSGLGLLEYHMTPISRLTNTQLRGSIQSQSERYSGVSTAAIWAVLALVLTGWPQRASAQVINRLSAAYYCTKKTQVPDQSSSDVRCGAANLPIVGDGITDDTSALRELFLSLVSAGGTIHLPNGRYLVSDSLALPASTHLGCAKGATFVAASRWPTPKTTSIIQGKPILVNQHFDAPRITDSDISIDGCSFDYTAITSVEGTHAIRIRMARHIRIEHVTCMGGNDCTAMLATDDTLVSHSICVRSTNACFDHWEGATNFVVSANDIFEGRGYGILGTGTDTAHATAGTASLGVIDGNQISGVGRGFAAIWLNGLGPRGSGASHIKVTNNTVDAGGNSAECIKFSGGGSNLLAAHNTCLNGNGPPAIEVAKDFGGVPTSVMIEDNLIDLWRVSSANVAAIVSKAPATSISNNRVKGGSYPYAIWFGGVEQNARENRVDSGTHGKYLSSPNTLITRDRGAQ